MNVNGIRVTLPLRSEVLEYEAHGRRLEVRKVSGPRYFLKLLGSSRARFYDFADEAREAIIEFLSDGRLRAAPH